MAFIRYGALLTLLILAQALPAPAQGRLKTMLEQVAALQEYIVTAEKGYRIAEEGVHLVRDITSGELDLHKDYFSSLATVDDAVLRCPALAEARRYIALLEDQARNEQTALDLLTTDGALSMTDGERIRLIQRLRDDLKVAYLKTLKRMIWYTLIKR